MKKALSLCLKYLSLFTVMGSIYYLIEIIWRGYSHVSMFILGVLLATQMTREQLPLSAQVV